MILTPEQLNIVNVAKQMCMNEILKINAFAGTGKTSTLIAIANALPEKKILYLAFNSAIVEESRKKFPKNVTIKTTHSLAYQKIVAPRNVEKIKPDYKPIEIANYYNIESSIAWEAINILNNFFASNEHTMTPKISEAHDIAYKTYLNMLSGEMGITHSFYLKQFQLLEDKELPEYDFILLDEAQDTNDVTLDIFLNIPGAKILVGDTHQSIYGFRGAEDAMQKVESDFNLFLTKTFRCSQKIVDRANHVLSYFKGENVEIVSLAPEIVEDNTYAVITRTNAKLIENIAEYDDPYKLFRHPESIFSTAINLHFWNTIQWEKIKPDFEYLKKFKNEKSLIAYIEDTNSIELKSSLAIAKRYKGRLFVIYKTALDYFKTKETGRIVLLTGHTSKGLEFDRVELENDFPSLKKLYEEIRMTQNELIEETNLYYVATTRAKHIIKDNSKNNEMFE